MAFDGIHLTEEANHMFAEKAAELILSNFIMEQWFNIKLLSRYFV